jgi:hypothetical protein
MKLIITIDTEEDNWGSYTPAGYTLENMEYIPRLQELFDRYDIKPTYLITYPVATDDRAIFLLRGILEGGGCEIGTHCHPWNTPPFEEETGRRNSMLCNLPVELQFRKLKNLHEAISRNFSITPLSFRAGRWGYSGEVASNLTRLGYRIDTSITPYTDWTPYHGPDMSRYTPEPYIWTNGDGNSLLELPATVGFLQRDFAVSNSIFNMSRHPYLRFLRLIGILDRLRIVSKVWFSPEQSSGQQMISLAKRMIKNNYGYLNMVFHSASLKSGLTPFVKSPDDEKRFLKHIEEFLIYSRDIGIKSIKLCEATP